MGEETEAAKVGKKVLSGAELSRQLDRLLEDKASNQRITDWVEVRLLLHHSTKTSTAGTHTTLVVCRPTWMKHKPPRTSLYAP